MVGLLPSVPTSPAAAAPWTGENEPGGTWEYPPLTTILLGVACCGRYYEAWR
jgi:hypothetical protein